jgi:uncharacterized protein YoxC
MNKEERIKKMHELIDETSGCRHGLHESYKSTMKKILLTYSIELLDKFNELEDPIHLKTISVQSLIDQFVDNHFKMSEE